MITSLITFLLVFSSILLVGMTKYAAAQVDSGLTRPPVLVVFTAKWCPHCQSLKPSIAQLKQNGYNIQELDYDSPGAKLYFEQYKVTSIPTCILFNGNKQVARSKAAPSFMDLLEMFRKNGIKPKSN
jgi:thiol-disulfide isomerase/thioredoxin